MNNAYFCIVSNENLKYSLKISEYPDNAKKIRATT